MDPVTAKLMSAAGAAAEPVYVDDVFSIDLWVGNTVSPRKITNGIDLAGEGGMVWGKRRSVSSSHAIADTENGVNKNLFPDSNDALVDRGTGGGSVTQFHSDGFSIGLASNLINVNGQTACSWTFRKSPGFFDIVTYTGTGSSGKTVSHSLGSSPGSIWVKRLDSADNWAVFHRSIGTSGIVELNNADATNPNSNIYTGVSSTNFTLGSDGSVNSSGGSYVAYVFAHDDQSFGDGGDEAIIKCGSYTGTGSAGLSINVGFEPQWLLIKRTENSGDGWGIYDNMRGIVSGGDDRILRANTSDSEDNVSFNALQLTSQGFNFEDNDTSINASSAEYIYIAIRRSHKPPEAGTDVFALDTSDNTRTNNMEFNAGFAVDWYFYASATGNGNRFFSHRLASGRELNINSSTNDSGATTSEMDSTTGCHNGSLADSGFIARMWKRAPGFCDVVNYTGNAIDRSVEHNLGVVPEMMIVKNRQAFKKWFVYHKEMTTTHAVYWNDNDAEFSTSVWYTDPVASVFYVSSGSDLNNSGDYHIALLFATLDGISKVGSYSGTGNDLNVDCGFTAGARFVMIKRIDGYGHWHQFDTEQGINSNDEPFLLLNGTTRTTGQDYIDPLNAGFTITSAAPDDINASGGTYIFLAIA